jgi:hypothetical protein
MTTDPLATVRAALDLAAKATPGPWAVYIAPTSPAGGLLVFDIGPGVDNVIATTCGDTESAAAAIVALRNATDAIAALADECSAARARIATLEAAAAAEAQAIAAPRVETAGECQNNSPAGFTGHWRDWHRGHGCDKDPEYKATRSPIGEV